MVLICPSASGTNQNNYFLCDLRVSSKAGGEGRKISNPSDLSTIIANSKRSISIANSRSDDGNTEFDESRKCLPRADRDVLKYINNITSE
ncbi:MAG: hypothetical protein ISS41_07155 [Candidatus Aminicenantes bacterium]|nr:hypothetical protein [Candidatus Aminicenantes bacterium]